MKKNLAIISVIIISFYFGGVVGFKKGLAAGDAASAPTYAILFTDWLKRIKKNEMPGATPLIQGQRDSQIVLHWIAYKEGPCIFDISSFNKNGLIFGDTALQIMKRVVKARNQDNPGYANNDLLAEAIHYYENQ